MKKSRRHDQSIPGTLSHNGKITTFGFETLVAEALRDIPRPPITDKEFLDRLEERFKKLPKKNRIKQVWWKGFADGLAAAAAGFVLLAGLTTIPPMFAEISLSGAEYLKSNVRYVSLRQYLWWEKVFINLQTQKNH